MYILFYCYCACCCCLCCCYCLLVSFGPVASHKNEMLATLAQPLPTAIVVVAVVVVVWHTLSCGCAGGSFLWQHSLMVDLNCFCSLTFGRLPALPVLAQCLLFSQESCVVLFPNKTLASSELRMLRQRL